MHLSGKNGVRNVHYYLVDVITFGPAGSEVCGWALQVIQGVCHELNVPLAVEKLEGPAAQLTFYGIEIDTEARILHPPQDIDSYPDLSFKLFVNGFSYLYWWAARAVHNAPRGCSATHGGLGP